eukprot:3969544-Pyramimonas_sp.AAC.1
MPKHGPDRLAIAQPYETAHGGPRLAARDRRQVKEGLKVGPDGSGWCESNSLRLLRRCKIGPRLRASPTSTKHPLPPCRDAGEAESGGC